MKAKKRLSSAKQWQMSDTNIQNWFIAILSKRKEVPESKIFIIGKDQLKLFHADVTSYDDVNLKVLLLSKNTSGSKNTVLSLKNNV